MVELTLECPVRVGVIEVSGLHVTAERTAYDAMQGCSERYRQQYVANGITSPGEVDGIQVSRSLYRALGIDPTKTRPSSEALLRRVLKGKDLYAVNTLVDVGNWVALDFLLSLGLYDRAKINGPITLRQGTEGESYAGIGKPPVHVAGRYVLADSEGPFGSPTSDSLRTSITLETHDALMVIFAPVDYNAATLASQSREAARRITEICGGHIERVEQLGR